ELAHTKGSFNLATTNSTNTATAAYGTRGITLAPPHTCFWFKPRSSDGRLVTTQITQRDTWCISRVSKARLNTTHIPSALRGNRCVRPTRAFSRVSNGAKSVFGETFSRNGSAPSEMSTTYKVVSSLLYGRDALITSPTDTAWRRPTRA